MQAFYQAELQPDLGLTSSPVVPLWGWLFAGERRILEQGLLIATRYSWIKA